VKNAGLSTKIILLLFVTKVAVGVIGGLVSHFLMNDISDMHFYTVQSLVEFDNLIHYPKTFFTDSLPTAYEQGLGDFFGSSNSFWNDLRNNILIKTMAVFNIFSRGNYYINSLFFNVAGFLGHMALFRIFKHIYPKQRLAIIVGCFLLPSTLYFTSLIGKDVMLFMALSIFCYSLYFSLENIFTAKRILLLTLSFIAILLIRNFIAVILLPCALAWYVSSKFTIKPLKVFGTFFLLAFAGIVLSQFLSEKYNPLKIVVEKQQAFFALGIAKSQYKNDTLQPTIKSFATAAPTALRHAFISPYPNEFNNIYLNGLAAEIILYLLFFLMMLTFKNSKNNITKNFIAFALIFTTLIFLFTGYITTNAGALVRYRSIYFPFLIIPILCNINWIKIRTVFYKQV
jgi:hypothetical protein